MENIGKILQCKISTSATVPAVADDAHGASDDDVKQRCCDKREALPGEPVCIICGWYGEYICDETDDDICSIECKEVVLERVAAKSKSQALVLSLPPIRLSIDDECYYVRDSVDKSGYNMLTVNQTEQLRKKLEISVKGDNVPAPVFSFASCSSLPEKLLQNLETAGYEIPTPVQMQAIPPALIGKSMLVSAETGSGKTGSFLVPIVSYCARINCKLSQNQRKPLAIVLTPTRELSIQVEEQARILGKGLPFKTALVVGGEAMAGQLHRIQQDISL